VAVVAARFGLAYVGLAPLPEEPALRVVTETPPEPPGKFAADVLGGDAPAGLTHRAKAAPATEMTPLLAGEGMRPKTKEDDSAQPAASAAAG